MVSTFPDVVTRIAGEEPVVSTFVGFVEANRDIADAIVDDIVPALARGETWIGIGHFGSRFTVRLATPADSLPPLPADTGEMHDLLAGSDAEACEAEDEPDWPDISEMVAAIEAAGGALERLGNLSIHMLQTAPLATIADLDAQRQAALARCRELLARINQMQEATYAH